jgi:hypothetical protein
MTDTQRKWTLSEAIPFVVRTDDRPLPHHLAGRTWTQTGYGAAIPSWRVAVLLTPSGREVTRRVYVTCYSNSGTSWFRHAGGRWIVDEVDMPGHARPFDAAARAFVGGDR